MPARKPPKKSDPLVVRMPHEDKEAFLDACRRDGRTASEVVRELIGGYVQRAAVRARLRAVQPERSLAMILRSPKTRIAAAASAAAGALASVALLGAPSAAEYDYRASFAKLDANDDGVISMDEYAGGGSHSTVELELPRLEGGAVATGAGTTAPGAASFVLEGSGGPREAGVVFAFMMDIGFTVADIDGDGAVDFDEFVRRHEQLLAEQFAAHDLDGDGQLSAGELVGSAAPMGVQDALFGALDRDDDGVVSLEEFQLGPAAS